MLGVGGSNPFVRTNTNSQLRLGFCIVRIEFLRTLAGFAGQEAQGSTKPNRQRSAILVEMRDELPESGIDKKHGLMKAIDRLRVKLKDPRYRYELLICGLFSSLTQVVVFYYHRLAEGQRLSLHLAGLTVRPGMAGWLLLLCLMAIIQSLLYRQLKTPSGNTLLCISTINLAVSTFLVLSMRPTGSQDIYWHATIVKGWVAYGRNPYLNTPSQLAFIDWSRQVIGWRWLSMTYGPLWIFLISPFVFAATSLTSLLVWLRLTFGLLMILAITRIQPHAALARDNSRNKYRLALFLASPVLLQYCIIDLHGDCLIMLAIYVAYLAHTRQRYKLSIATLTAAGFIKYVPWLLLVIPITAWCQKIWIDDHRRIHARLAQPLLFSATLLVLGLGLYLPFGLNHRIFEALFNEGSQRLSNTSIALPSYLLIYSLGIRVLTLRIIGVLVSAIGLSYATWRGKSELAFAFGFWPLLLVATPWLAPWYFIWTLPIIYLLVKPFWSTVISVLIVVGLLPLPFLLSSLILIALIVIWLVFRTIRQAFGLQRLHLGAIHHWFPE